MTPVARMFWSLAERLGAGVPGLRLLLGQQRQYVFSASHGRFFSPWSQ